MTTHLTGQLSSATGVAVRLPFVLQYPFVSQSFWEHLGGCGHQNVPHKSEISLGNLALRDLAGEADSTKITDFPWKSCTLRGDCCSRKSTKLLCKFKTGMTELPEWHYLGVSKFLRYITLIPVSAR